MLRVPVSVFQRSHDASPRHSLPQRWPPPSHLVPAVCVPLLWFRSCRPSFAGATRTRRRCGASSYRSAPPPHTGFRTTGRPAFAPDVAQAQTCRESSSAWLCPLCRPSFPSPQRPLLAPGTRPSDRCHARFQRHRCAVRTRAHAHQTGRTTSASRGEHTAPPIPEEQEPVRMVGPRQTSHLGSRGKRRLGPRPTRRRGLPVMAVLSPHAGSRAR